MYDDVSHRGRNAGIASFAIVLVIILAGFVVSVPITSKAQVLIPFTSTSYSFSTVRVPVSQTNTVTYMTSSISTETITQQVTTTSRVWDVGSTTLNCSNTQTSVEWTFAESTLSAGMDVNVSWSASNTVDVYVFNSTQYGNWVSSGVASSNIAGENNAPTNASLSFQVQVSGTYYLVLRNPHLGLFCEGSSNLGIYSAVGTATYLALTVSNVVQTNTYTTSSKAVTTQTLTTTIVSSTVISGTNTTTTTESCSSAFWSSLFGSKSCS